MCPENMSNFQRLIRFEDSQGQVHYGELGSGNAEDLNFTGLEVQTYAGSTPWAEDFCLTATTAKISRARLLHPYEEMAVH